MRIHIVGIEGAGTSALAQLYASAGHSVSGSDDGDGFYRAQLASCGVVLYADFDATHVPEDADLVVYSTAFGDNHQEVVQARAYGIRVVTYPQAVAEIFNAMMGIAVCGTHGKTTTTALLAEILAQCGRDPRAIVGSQVVGWHGNALTGSGDVMVLEADEYQNKLRYYNPFAVILTSVDYDHPDFFATPDDYRQVFCDFVARIPQYGFLVAYGDSASVRSVIAQARCDVVTYGFGEGNDVVIKPEGSAKDGFYKWRFRGSRFGTMVCALRLPGQHNACNAVAAAIVAQKLQCAQEDITQGIARFRGARRRFELYGVYNGAILVDDYAHHPEEIRATLAATRNAYPERHIVAAFHPHTFTRTKALLTEFAQSFDDADRVIVLDIYGSAREAHGGVCAQDLVAMINRAHPRRAEHIADIATLAQWARAHIGDGDLFLTLGAGDIWKVMGRITDGESVAR